MGRSRLRMSGRTPDSTPPRFPRRTGSVTPRSLARTYGACVSGIDLAGGGRFRVLSPERVEAALVQQTSGPDRVLMGMDIQWGLGFMLNVGTIALAGLGRPRSFGHFGMGGSVGWARPLTSNWVLVMS